MESRRETLFAVEGLWKRFGAVAALSDVSFEVRRGEVLGLIGPNGAGKSTLFECLAGVLPYDRGEVRGAADAPLLFYMPDGIVPWEAQRVGWILDYMTGLFGGHREMRRVVVEELGLGGFERRAIGTLSKGERKRALLAAALMTPQPALMIDEPFDGLDLRQMREAAEVLRRHAAQGRTLFLSIHQIADAARLCDRFVLLSNGRVCGEGTVEDLRTLAGKRAAGRFETLEEVFLALT
jgi:ABC-2 type transport system ATP-binding protein